MTDSQFETLRQELRALRSDFDQRFDSVNQRFDSVETRLTRLEIHLDTKPDKASVFQTLFTINASFLAVIGLAIPVFHSLPTP
jgi:hypothetical protein